MSTLKASFSDIERLVSKFKSGENSTAVDPELLENLAEELRMLRE